MSRRPKPGSESALALPQASPSQASPSQASPSQAAPLRGSPSRAAPKKSSFSARVIAWQRTAGRHDLPWQNSRDAYRIWVSEIMLQQTQVATAIPYFQRLMAEFPTLGQLAAAPLERVMQLWSGLGYYSRARNLHQCAQQVVQQFGGQFPRDPAQLQTLPGIGRSTAAAIAALAYGVPAAILDGNVKRVIARHFGVAGYPGAAAVQKALWQVAERELPSLGIEPYTQGLMDLGAGVCARTRPLCPQCPISATCVAFNSERISELPASKPRTVTRKRFSLMLLVERDQSFLVGRRPPSGIWGGLWSLPELAIDAAEFAAEQLSDALQQRIDAILQANGLSAGSQRRLQRLEHQFTHFRLGILPLLIQAINSTEGASRLSEPTLLWLPASDVLGAALPKPVKTLLIAQVSPDRP